MVNLKPLRLQSKVKQEVVALSLNMSASAVSKLEAKPLAVLPLDKLAKYIESLGGELSAEITMPNGEKVNLMHR